MSRPPHGDVLDIPTPPLQRTALVIIFIFPSFAIILYSLRAHSRITTRQYGLDDILCALALLFSILMTPPMFMYIKLGYFGWKLEDVPMPYDPAPGLWWNFLVQMFYNPVLALVKASILVFLSRLGGHKNSVRYCIIALHCLNTGHAISVFFSALFQCLPMEANWDFSVRMDPDTRCIDNSFHVIASCITILTDFLILALPFWIFLGLKMPWAAKLVVIGVFLMGSIVAIVGIIRVIDIYKLFFVMPEPGTDVFHNIILVYSVVEVNLAIICACIPALRPLFRRWFPRLFGGSTQSGSGAPYSGNTFGSSTVGAGSHHARHAIALKSLRSDRSHATTVIRSSSPAGSEEGIMGYNGIIRTTDVNVAYEPATYAESRSSDETKPPGRQAAREAGHI